MAHIKNRDILASSIAAMIAGVISAAANVLQLSFLFGSEDEDNPLGLVGSLAAMILAPVGATLLQLGVSRQREYLADATAAQLPAGQRRSRTRSTRSRNRRGPPCRSIP
jgi:heat shock protein HtpX